MMEKFKAMVMRHTSKAPVSQPRNSNIQLSLLRSFVGVASSQQKAKISMNLLAAAMHLAYLKSAVQNKLVIELPDDPLALAQRLVAPTFY